MAQPFWEAAYADLNSVAFAGGASAEIRDIAALLPKGAKVLDLGCGEGRNALFLAECGLDVTAVDISEAGIGKLRALAGQKGLAIHAEVCDMRSYSFPHPFDLIVSHGCLHLVERGSWQNLIDLFKTHTNVNGYNAITVFTDAIPPPEDLKDFCLGLFFEGELFSLYEDWETVLQRSYTLEDQHPGSPPHKHPINKLVARTLGK
jgi:tellurite methyltransferase